MAEILKNLLTDARCRRWAARVAPSAIIVSFSSSLQIAFRRHRSSGANHAIFFKFARWAMFVPSAVGWHPPVHGSPPSEYRVPRWPVRGVLRRSRSSVVVLIRIPVQSKRSWALINRRDRGTTHQGTAWYLYGGKFGVVGGRADDGMAGWPSSSLPIGCWGMRGHWNTYWSFEECALFGGHLVVHNLATKQCPGSALTLY